MRIERRFYTEFKERAGRMMEEAAVEGSRQTEEDRREIERLVRRGEHLKRAMREISNEKKVLRFSLLSDLAVDLAERMPCDIVVESDMETTGKIILKGEHLLFGKSKDGKWLDVFLGMFELADQVWFTAEGNVIRGEFRYRLSDTAFMEALL